MSLPEFKTPCQPNWCPGCGDFGIWSAIKLSLHKLGLGPPDFCAVYGVGCHGHMVNFLKSYAIETLHGRPVPVAQGVKMANHTLPVLIMAGDGDTFGEGTNHLIHAARRNMDLTMVVHDNQVYGLTTGQTAPTSKKGFKTKSTPTGVIEEAVNPLAIALAGGATFVARGFAGDIPMLVDLIIKGINHKGFSYIDIFQPCVTFNHVNTYQWFRENIYKLPKEYKANDRAEAHRLALQWDKIPIGIFYKEEKPTYESQVVQLGQTPLINHQDPQKDIIANLLTEFV